jgi:adenine-specific DNA-methyltransferase
LPVNTPTVSPVTASDPAAQSADTVSGNIQTLKTLFPDAFAEGKIDFDVLRQLLGDAVDDGDEKYGLNWSGKRQARRLALTPSLGTLRPASEDSVDWDATRNLMIEGDNLEVLKLLQKGYAGKVKLIYIDPPYNTGNDFVYPDDYADNLSNYLRRTGQVDEDGIATTSNREGSGRFHTDWMNMIYPRLMAAREMLTQSGAIFVSCDDNEVARLTMIMNEVFGEENFVSKVVWQRSKKGDSKLIAKVHEYIICYAKNKDKLISVGPWRRPKLGAGDVLDKYEDVRQSLAGDHAAIRTAMMTWYRELPEGDPRKAHKHYSWSDDRGLYFPDNFAGPDDGRTSRPRHDIVHPVTGLSCKKPSTGWRWDQEKTDWALSQIPPRIHFGEDESTIPNRKSYLAEIDSEPFTSVFYRDGRSATLEVEGLVGKGLFPFPKNTDVLLELIELVTKGGDIVLDFFAGSGSTGHAVMNLNARNNAQRRFVLVQLPEPTGREALATIADLTKERLRQASAKIKVEHPGSAADLGFRVYKLATSNLKVWQPGDDLQADLLSAADNLAPGRSEDDLLVELLLKQGIDLCEPVVTKVIADRVVHAFGGGILAVCLADVAAASADALADGMAEWLLALTPSAPTTVFFKDSGFENDTAKTNVAAILEQRLGDQLLKVRSV